MSFSLTNQQKEAVEHRNSSILVSAGAGSGKTRVLVERLLMRVVEEKKNIDQFLVITFTKAAAEELRGRIAEELTDRLALDPTNHHLRRQLTLVYKAQISTIHSFCGDLLRENAHLIDLNPNFRLCTTEENQVLMLEVVEEVIENQYVEANSDFIDLVNTLAYARDDSRLGEIIIEIFDKIQSHPNPRKWLVEQQEIWRLEGVTDVGQTPWGRLILEGTTRQASYAKELLERADELAEQDEIVALNYKPAIAAALQIVEDVLEASRTGWDSVDKLSQFVFPRAGTKKSKEPQDIELREKVKTLRATAQKIIKDLANIENNQELLVDLQKNGKIISTLMELIQRFSEQFALEKERRGMLDFVDLEHKTVALLTTPEGEPTLLAIQKSQALAEVMVDEYQDTNLVQNTIFDAITGGGRTLFAVGDVKQSIYRFRLADPSIFLEKYRRFQRDDNEGKPIILSENFRSRPEVIDACNHLFSAIMSIKFGEMDYTEDQKLLASGSFPAQEREGAYRTKLALLNRETPEDQEEKLDKDELEANWVATEIETMLQEHFKVTKSGKSATISPDDIMILLRSPSKNLHHYVAALEDKNIPWSAKGEEEIFQTTEVCVALALLKIIDNPRQDVPLLAALRSPIFRFSVDELAKIKEHDGDDFYHSMTVMAENGDEKCCTFLEKLNALRFDAGDKTTRELIWHMYTECNFLPIFGAMEGGETRQNNLLELYQIGGRLEESGCRTLFPFLLRLEQLKATSNLPKRSKKVGKGVSILSIHGSKGLEKPVVFVCGLARDVNLTDSAQTVLFHQTYGVGTKGLDHARLIRYPTLARMAIAKELNREAKAEEMRLLYVAMTRAQDKLILVMTLRDGLKTVKKLGDLLPIHPQGIEAQSSVGKWILLHALTRPESAPLAQLAGISDHSPLPLPSPWEIQYVENPTHLTQSTTQEGESEGAPEPEPHFTEAQLDRIRRFLTWEYRYQTDVDSPSKYTATQSKGRAVDGDSDTENSLPPDLKDFKRARVPSFAQKGGKISAAEQGTAIHLMMEYLDFSPTLDTSVEGITAKKEQLYQEKFFTKEQYAAISPQKISNFLQSTLGVAACHSLYCRQEFPFSLLVKGRELGMETEEKLLFQGVVDCYFEEEDGITLIDFKSDRVTDKTVEERAQSHKRQLDVYQLALERMLGKKVTHKVIWFFALDRGVEV
ncbi:MAG: helicase-exonuclease AddAB subunit AddA [Eubacteriales bacterium]